MPGVRNTVRGGVRETDDGSGSFIPGESVGSYSVNGLREVVGAQVAGRTHADTAWEGNGGETSLVIHVPRCRATYLEDGISGRRGTAELPR